LHPDNQEKFLYVRIPTWWERGYRGNGVKVAVFEDTSKGHGRQVADIVSQVAPEAEVLSKSRPLIVVEAGRLTPDTHERIIAFYRSLVNEGINLVVMSLGGTGTADIEALERDILHAGGITMLTSAGNDGDPIESYESAFLSTWIAVGAVELVKGKPVRRNYSEAGPQLDIMSFTNCRNTWGGYFEGTSCAAPFATGMLALYFQWHKEQVGRFPTPDEAYAFVTTNVEDLGDPDFDDYMGYGLFRLPEVIKMPEEQVYRLFLSPFGIDGRDNLWRVQFGAFTSKEAAKKYMAETIEKDLAKVGKRIEYINP
jgi:hypothetical protein